MLHRNTLRVRLESSQVLDDPLPVIRLTHRHDGMHHEAGRRIRDPADPVETPLSDYQTPRTVAHRSGA